MEKKYHQPVKTNKMILHLDEIKKLLPHRTPFLFLDKVEIIEIGKKGTGYKKFLPNEFFFTGHFPESPIVPGVILIETLAQTAGVVVSKSFIKIVNRLKHHIMIINCSMVGQFHVVTECFI